MIESAELASANTAQKCWVLVNGKVYDVTKYLQDHPGGDQILLKHSGTKDATKGFEQAEHTKGALDKMETMMIGEYQKKEGLSTLTLSFLKDITLM